MKKSEKIVKRADGQELKIIVSISLDFHSEKYVKFIVDVEEKINSTFRSIDLNNISYVVSCKKRAELISLEQLKYVTAEEIYEAKIALWESFKPCL